MNFFEKYVIIINVYSFIKRSENMKICPKCGKSNPDNSKKCFFCREDLSQVHPYVPEPEPLPEEIEEEEEFEEEEPKEVKVIAKKKNKKIKFYAFFDSLPKSDPSSFYAVKILPVLSVIILVLGVFVTICLFTAYKLADNLPKAIIVSVTALIGTLFMSILTLWMGGILEMCRKFTEKSFPEENDKIIIQEDTNEDKEKNNQ